MKENFFSVLAFILSVLAEENATHLHKELLNDTENTDDTLLIPCEKGWYFFEEKCYKIGGKWKDSRLNWKNASSQCKSDGGTLVTISSKKLEDFLIAFLLLDGKTHVWIGIQELTNQTGTVWEDGSSTSYRNWEPEEPSRGAWGVMEGCVQMVFTSGKVGGKTGQWNLVDCSSEVAYICQAERSTIKSPDLRFCPGSGEGWKYQDSCYYLVKENKSWLDAETHCKVNFDGHLLMVNDFTVGIFLDFILSNFSEEIWIGIKIKKNSVQKWTSGWHVAYNDWSKDQVEFEDDTCVLMSKPRRWKTNQCTNMHPFVCEKSSSAEPPVLKPAAVGAHCPEKSHDWLDLGGNYCYFFDTSNRYTWRRANFECIRRGGHLAKIHSQKESDILKPFVVNKQSKVFIGLHRHSDNEDIFVWTDGSRLKWTNWGSGKPNNIKEKCVELWTQSMRWNDIKCEEENGYICSARKVLDEITETQQKSFYIVEAIFMIIIILLLIYICIRWKRRKAKSKGLPRNLPSADQVQIIHSKYSEESENIYQEIDYSAFMADSNPRKTSCETQEAPSIISVEEESNYIRMS